MKCQVEGCKGDVFLGGVLGPVCSDHYGQTQERRDARERRERLAAQMLAALVVGRGSVLAREPEEQDARIDAAIALADRLIAKLDGRKP